MTAGHAKYLIVGSSHAALEAAACIRMADEEGGIVMLTRDRHLPYSPTILPYVVSGRSAPERVTLKDEAWFAVNRIDLRRGARVTAVDPTAKTVTSEGAGVWSYDRLLLATGAAPAVPPIPGLAEVPYHVLRTLDDATNLKDAIGRARRAVVLGAGLVGMHAAENLAKAGVGVTVVEREAQVLPGYFDGQGAAMIADAFTAKGVRLLLGHSAAAVEPGTVVLGDGRRLEFDLLLVAAGVRPETSCLAGSGIEVDRGVLVDDRMRTSATDIWAAGDVAQARAFLDDGKIVAGILPYAVEQGRIAGMDMAGDKAVKPFPGSLPINTYTFFGQRAVSVGQVARDVDGARVESRLSDDRAGYSKMVLKDGRLIGAAAINLPIDAGVMWQLILRRIDLSPVMADFLARPHETGRALMSQTWR